MTKSIPIPTPRTPTPSRGWVPRTSGGTSGGSGGGGTSGGGGFSLIELVAILSLVALFILMAAHLWRANHIAFRDAENLTAETTRLDLILDKLQRDAWSAQDAIIIDNGDGVIFKRADAPATIWHHTEAGQLQRLEIVDHQMPLTDHTWPPFTHRITFHESPAGLNVTLTPKTGAAPPPLTLRLNPTPEPPEFSEPPETTP